MQCWCLPLYTAISSPKQSGKLSVFNTWKSRAAPSSPAPSPCPQLSRSSLSSVLDSYSDPIPDSLNRSSSSAPSTCSPIGELSSGASSLGESPVSPVPRPCSWPSGPREENRKHSRRTALPPRLLSAPAVLEGQDPGRKGSHAPSLICCWDTEAKGPVEGDGVSGSLGVLGGRARKVISRRLSWEPTEDTHVKDIS